VGVLAVVTTVAAMYALLCRTEAVQPPSIGNPSSNTTPSPDAMVSAPNRRAPQNGAQVPTTSQAESAKSVPMIAFEQSGNLADFLQHQAALGIDPGSAKALRYEGQVLEECLGLSIDKTFRSEIEQRAANDPRDGPLMLALLRTYEARCKQVASRQRIRLAEIAEKYEHAAAAGDPLAKAKMLGKRLDQLSAAQVHVELSAILASRDPEAIFEISELMGDRSFTDRESEYAEKLGVMSGSELYPYAWQLAVCDLGLDCGPQSWIVRATCLNGGVCGEGNYREIVRRFYLAPASFERMEELERQISTLLRDGNPSNLFP
jgi:hypothetical protein